MKNLIPGVLAAFLAAGAAQAQTADGAPAAPAATDAPHAYVGLGVGIVSDPTAGGRRANAKIFGGYEFNRNWGVEAGFTRFRTSEFTAINMRPDGYDLAQASLKTSRAYLAGKYAVPINEKFSAYGKLGLSHSESKVSAGLPGWNYTVSDNGLYAGLGAQYKLTREIAAVVEYERFGKRKEGGPKADVYSAGLKYSF
jgi:OOP family OmpA-OmpF porin